MQIKQIDLSQETSIHFSRSIRKEAAYSDTWRVAFDRKGHLYEQAELDQMLAPGNRVNQLIRNLGNYLDPSGFDPGNLIHRALLAIGESPVGHPLADLTIEGRACSSLFLFNLITAAEVIEEVQRAGIDRPRILEIGGGYGTLCGLLRAYYGSELTVFAADLPETLAVQEWYLRTRFPDAPTTFAADHDPAEFVQGGLNFINAHILATQPFAFDIAINIISMGEMTSTVAHAYLRFIERNITPGGFFYFMNAHAQCSGGTPEVTEYDFDAHWSLSRAKLLTPFDGMAWTALMRFVLTRSTETRDPDVRRLSMRILLNQAHTGFLDVESIRDDELVRLSEEADIKGALERLTAMIGDSNPALTLAATLTDRIYVPQSFFDIKSHLVPHSTGRGQIAGRTVFDSIKRFEGDLVTAMRDAVGAQDQPPIDQLAHALHDREAAVGDFLARIHKARLSEYWTGWVAAMLGTLGHADAAASLILACFRDQEPVSTVWLTRLTFLLQRFAFPGVSEALGRLVARDDISSSDRLKVAEMQAFAEQKAAACATFDEILKSPWPHTLRPVLIKTALRIGRRDLALSLLPPELGTRLDTAAFSIEEGDLEFALAALHHGEDALLATANDAQRVACGSILLAAGDVRRGAHYIAGPYDAAGSDYFMLGNIGRQLHWAGAHDWAEYALTRALALGPRNVQQLRYVGLARMSGHEWSGAAACFGRAAAIVPHLPGLAGREAFCRLASDVRNAGIFGTVESLSLVYLDEPAFYHDIGFRYK